MIIYLSLCKDTDNQLESLDNLVESIDNLVEFLAVHW